MPSHRVIEEWMGEQVETLEDLLRPGLRAVCVGINPSPVSGAAGHYYQSRSGQRFFAHLRKAGVLDHAPGEWEDDASFGAGIGFTDVIKRPTPSATGIPAAEFGYGKSLLLEKLRLNRPAWVIFVFKKSAETLFGKFPCNGFVHGLRLGESQVFVMPGPMEALSSASETLNDLAEQWRDLGCDDGDWSRRGRADLGPPHPALRADRGGPT